MDQLTLLCIFNSFNMKNNFFLIDSMDILHLKKKSCIYCILGKILSALIINLGKSKSGFQLLMLLYPKYAMGKFETENSGFHRATFLVKRFCSN